MLKNSYAGCLGLRAVIKVQYKCKIVKNSLKPPIFVVQIKVVQGHRCWYWYTYWYRGLMHPMDEISLVGLQQEYKK